MNCITRVPYVPTSKRTVRKIVEYANIQPKQKVYDLGCGDGRFLLEAEKKYKAHAEGYELAPLPYILAQFKRAFHKANFKIHCKNFFEHNLEDANVIICYLGPETMDKLGEKILKECKKGTKIICNTFRLKTLTPVKVWEKNPKSRLPSIYLYEI